MGLKLLLSNYEHDISFLSKGHIRSLCVTQDGTSMAVGFSGGFLSLVDLRGGILTRQWKAHEADIIQVKK